MAEEDHDSAEEGQNDRLPPQRPPALFITNPWQCPIDLTTKAGGHLWTEGTKPMEEKFDGTGQDVSRFVAIVKNQVQKCCLDTIVQFGRKNLLVDYGTISLEDVLAARDQRDGQVPTTLQEAQPLLKAKMLYHYVYNSLGKGPLRKVATKVDDIREDGPTLLKVVLTDTFVASQAHTYHAKEKIFDLQLKAYKWNVQAMNQAVRETILDLKAAGQMSSESDTILSLFRAYGTASNEEFKNAIMYWKNDWSEGKIQTAEQLMLKADGKYDELKRNGTWAKKSQRDEEIIALNAKIKLLQGNKANKGVSEGNDSKPEAGKDNKIKKNISWKYDRTLSQGTTLIRSGKTYKWCTGPGHNGVAMWVCKHEPGKCELASEYAKAKNNNVKKEKGAGFSRAGLTAMLKTQDATLSEAEVESKVNAMMAILDS